MKLSNVKDTKKIEVFLAEKVTEINYSCEDEKPPRHSKNGKMKYLQQTLNQMNEFIMLLVMSCVGSRLELLRVSGYIIMKPF